MHKWRARVAWLVILSLVFFIVYRNTRSTPALDAAGDSLDDFRMQMVAKEAIGFKSLGAPNLNQTRERLLHQMDAEVKTPADKLHVAIIAGEILGKDPAVKRLDELPGDLTGDISTLRVIYSSGAAALDSTARNRLIQHHGFFARVALSYGVDAGQEPRKSMEADATRSMGKLIAVGLVLLLVLVGCVGFFIVAVVLKSKGRLRRAYVPNPAANSAYLEGFAIYFVLFILGFGLLRRFFRLESLQWEWLALLILPVVMMWFQWRGASRKEQWQALGWNTGRGVFREIGAGLAGYLAGIVIVIAGFIVTFLLMKRTGISPEHPIVHMLQGNRWHVLGLYLLASVFAPVMEETMFRGALFHHLRRRWGWAVSAPVVALIFAIIHPQGWVAVPVLGSIAIVLAGLREWRGSLIAPMTAHAFNNFLALTLALALLR